MQFLNNRVRFLPKFIFFQTRPKRIVNFMLKPCCRNLFKIAELFCHLASSFNRTARLHTRQSWLKTGLLPTAVNSLVKMNGLRTRLSYHVWGDVLECYKSFQPKPEHIDELKKVLQLIWDQLPQDSINKAIMSFPKRLWACVKAGGGHFEHMLKCCTT